MTCTIQLSAVALHTQQATQQLTWWAFSEF